MSMKIFNDTIGNRSRDLPTCSAVPQPTALPRYMWVDGLTIEGMPYFALIFNFSVAILMLKTVGWGSAGSTACSSTYLSIIRPMYI